MKDRTTLPTYRTNKCLYIFAYVNTFLYLCSTNKNINEPLEVAHDTNSVQFIMKQNIIDLLKFITAQGYDNSQWGICDSEVETDTFFGTYFKHTAENFIYVYWKTDDDTAGHFLDNNDPDYFLSLKATADEYLYIFKY